MHIFAKKRINESHKSDFALLLFWGFTAKTFSLRASVQELLANVKKSFNFVLTKRRTCLSKKKTKAKVHICLSIVIYLLVISVDQKWP